MTDWMALRKDPLFLAYLRRAERFLPDGGQPQMHSPNQVIGEQRAFAMLIADQEETLAVSGKKGRRLAEDLIQAVPFLWLNEIDAIAAALPIPRHVIREDLFPYDRCWWTYEGAHPMKDEHGHTHGWADGVVLVKWDGWYHYAYVGEAGPDLKQGHAWGALRSGFFRPGWVWPDDIPEAERPAIGRILAMQSFLDSPFVDTSLERRTSGKKTTHQPRVSPETVRFVRLRSPLLTETERREGRAKDWAVRWIVRGHIRAQWYPSSQSHKLIWIAPYEKGPEGAPLKTPAYAVVR